MLLTCSFVYLRKKLKKSYFWLARGLSLTCKIRETKLQPKKSKIGYLCMGLLLRTASLCFVRDIFPLAFRKVSETGSGVLALLYTTLFFIGVNRFSIQIWKCQFLFKGKSVQFVRAQLTNGLFLLLQLWRERMISR